MPLGDTLQVQTPPGPCVVERTPADTAVSTATFDRAHFAFLDGMRAIAALLIVLHHAILQTWPISLYPDAIPERVMAVFSGWMFYSNFGVIFFIALSGFCLMIPVVRRGGLRDGAGGFLLYRLRRIMPPYYAALGGSIILALAFIRANTHTLYDNSLPVTLRGVLYHIFLIQNLDIHTKYQINGPLWSIAIEVQIYLLFPLFIWIWQRRGIGPVLALGLVLTTVAHYLVRGTNQAGFSSTYISIFTMGMYASLLVFNDNWSHHTYRRGGALMLIYAMPVVALLPIILPTQSGALVRNHSDAMALLAGAISASFLVIMGRNPRNLFRRALSWAPLVWIGGFSYSIYLIHFPLQQLFWQVFVMNRISSHGLGFALVSTVGTALIVLCAWGFYRAFEKPFMHMKPRA